MTVQTTQVNTPGYTVLWAHSDMVDSIAKAAIVSQIEAVIDCVIDTQDSTTDRQAVKLNLVHAQADAARLASDLMDELKSRVLQRIMSMSVSTDVPRMDWDKDGEISDIVVDISFK